MLETLLLTITALLTVAFIIVLSVLCMPVRVSVIFDTQNRPAMLFRVALFGGLLPIVSTARRRQKRPAKKQTKAASIQSRMRARRNVAAFARRLLRNLPMLVSKIVSRVRLERVDAKIRFGLADPANTGVVYGALMPLLQLIGVTERSSIVLHPDFGHEVFDGQGHIGARFVPIALIAPMLSFAWVTMVLPRLSEEFR